MYSELSPSQTRDLQDARDKRQNCGSSTYWKHTPTLFRGRAENKNLLFGVGPIILALLIVAVVCFAGRIVNCHVSTRIGVIGLGEGSASNVRAEFRKALRSISKTIVISHPPPEKQMHLSLFDAFQIFPGYKNRRELQLHLRAEYERYCLALRKVTEIKTCEWAARSERNIDLRLSIFCWRGSTVGPEIDEIQALQYFPIKRIHFLKGWSARTDGSSLDLPPEK